MHTGATGESIQARTHALTTYNLSKLFRYPQEAA
jgi:hypothetical protein